MTYIKYEKGDFFKSHEDYLSFTSNMVEEYTFIMCVNANCEGGRTIFYVNDFFTHKSTESKEQNHCMIFRKDIKHEGEMISSGSKEILTFNLLGLPKTSVTLIVIQFNNEERRYYISKDKIDSCGDNLFTSFLHFKGENEKICVYMEKEYTYDEFEIIYRILNKCYISINEYKMYKIIIDYYQISISNILLTEFNSNPKKIQNRISFDSDIILNETPEQTQFILEMVKENSLPFIPFKLVLIEGTIVYGGEASDTPPLSLKMSPVWLSFSEMNNILFHKSLVNLENSNQSLSEILSSDTYMYPDIFEQFENSGKSYVDVHLEEEEEDEKKQEDDNKFWLNCDYDDVYDKSCVKLEEEEEDEKKQEDDNKF